MDFALTLVYVVSAYFLFQAIYKSEGRWSSCLYAVLGFFAYIGFYAISVLIIMNVKALDTPAINKIISGAGWVGLTPLIIGANIPPRRA